VIVLTDRADVNQQSLWLFIIIGYHDINQPPIAPVSSFLALHQLQGCRL